MNAQAPSELISLLHALENQEALEEDNVNKWTAIRDATREKRIAVQTTIGLFAKADADEEKTSESGEVETRRKLEFISGMGLGQAVLTVVRRYSTEKGLSRPEIVDLLKKNNFKYNGDSKNIYSSVSITVSRLSEPGALLEVVMDENEKRYRPKKDAI